VLLPRPPPPPFSRTTTVCFTLYNIVVKEAAVASSECRVLLYYHLYVWSVALAMAAAPLIAGAVLDDPVYASVGPWCWIRWATKHLSSALMTPPMANLRTVQQAR
jgi:hypothetical protein